MTIAADANDSNASLTIAITDAGTDLAKKTVCIKVRLSSMGNTRKVSTAQIEADADKDLLRVSKQLVDSAELKAITRFDSEIRRFLYNICLPFEIGIHLLPIAALQTVEQKYDALREQNATQLLRTASLETRIDDLSARLKAADSMVQEHERFLASDRDIRALSRVRLVLRNGRVIYERPS